jgi:hypothetical protein
MICNRVCSGGENEEGQPCGSPPAPFDSTETCLFECQKWDVPQRWMAQFCVDAFDCNPGAEVCFPPPTETAENTGETCDAMWALCGGEEGYQMPKDSEFCSWILTGIAQSNPAIDFSEAVDCIEKFEACPEDGGGLFICMVASYPPCEDYCDKLVDCKAPTTQDACMTQCSAGYAFAPDETDKAIECVSSNKCKDLGDCFKPEEEDPERPE